MASFTVRGESKKKEVDEGGFRRGNEKDEKMNVQLDCKFTIKGDNDRERQSDENQTRLKEETDGSMTRRGHEEPI